MDSRRRKHARTASMVSKSIGFPATPTAGTRRYCETCRKVRNRNTRTTRSPTLRVNHGSVSSAGSSAKSTMLAIGSMSTLTMSEKALPTNKTPGFRNSSTGRMQVGRYNSGDSLQIEVRDSKLPNQKPLRIPDAACRQSKQSECVAKDTNASHKEAAWCACCVAGHTRRLGLHTSDTGMRASQPSKREEAGALTDQPKPPRKEHDDAEGNHEPRNDNLVNECPCA